MGERRRLREQLEGYPVAGEIGIQQVAGESQQLAPVFRHPTLVDAVIFFQPRPGIGMVEGCRARRDAYLALLACYRETIHAHLTASIALAEKSPAGLLMPNQSL